MRQTDITDTRDMSEARNITLTDVSCLISRDQGQMEKPKKEGRKKIKRKKKKGGNKEANEIQEKI